MDTTRRARRRTRPGLENLEERRLLDARTRLAVTGTEINDKDLRRLLVQLANRDASGQRIPASDRRLSYQTSDGRTVVVTLYGKGTLAGSTVTDGVLDLVYDLTDNQSRIVGRVVGRGTAPLAGIRDASSAPRSSSSAGVDPINAVVLHTFDLIDGGYVNLTGGVLQLNLNSVGRGTEIHLKEGTPPPTQQQQASVIVTGAAAIGGVTQTTTVAQTTPTTTTGPTGIEVTINRVEAGPLGSPPLGNPQVFAVDPTAGALIRFDTVTGQPTLTVPLPPLTTADPAVGLARVADRLLALVGDGPTVRAFDSVTGAPAGQFTVANLAPAGLTRVDGLGGNATRTLLTQSGGPAITIDAAASLALGEAVPASGPFVPQRQAILTGGATAVGGSDVLYAGAAAHFDPFQPMLDQFGLLALNATATGLRETSRTAIPATTTGTFINAGPPDALLPDPSTGLGSVEGSIARITGLADGRNVVSLYNPSTLAPVGTLTLRNPNRLSGLGETFYPEIRGAALIDVQGNLKRFVGQRAAGLVINGRSTVNLVAIHTATDTAVVGRPINHVEIPVRNNVVLVSTARGTNGMVDRGDVVVDPKLSPLGPIALP